MRHPEYDRGDHKGCIVIGHPPHQQVQAWTKDLNALYKSEPALYERDFEFNGFEWLDMGYDQRAIFSFLRKGYNPENNILVVCNFGNISRSDYHIGCPVGGKWREILNSDDLKYGGQGITTGGKQTARPHTWIAEGRNYSTPTSFVTKDYNLKLTLPPLSVIFLKHVAV